MKFRKFLLAVFVFIAPMDALSEVVTVKTSKIEVDRLSNSGLGPNFQQSKPKFLPVPIQFAPPAPLKIGDSEPDYPFGAYQRGYYLTALHLAILEADEGDSAAQTLLGSIYETGLAVGKDEEEARQWYEIAAQNGNSQASYRLGVYHLYGRGGLEIDPKQAASYFMEASKKGVIGAMLNLGLLYKSGLGVKKDLERAEKLLEEVASKEIPEAQYILGTALLDGEFGRVDEEGAAQWLGKAARNGHVSAQVRYGIIRFQGRGIEADEEEGANWFLLAADIGNLIAMNRLANIYLAGRGLQIDVPEAAKWHLISRRLGFSDEKLDATLKSLSEEDIKEANYRANTWLNRRNLLVR